jgi:hypothetical protein
MVGPGWPGLVAVGLGWYGLAWVGLLCSATFAGYPMCFRVRLCFPGVILCLSVSFCVVRRWSRLAWVGVNLPHVVWVGMS